MLKRFITGIILIGLGIWVILGAGSKLLIFCAIISLVIAYEMYQMSPKTKQSFGLQVASYLCIVVAYSMVYLQMIPKVPLSITSLAVGCLFGLFLVELYKRVLILPENIVIYTVRTLCISMSIIFLYLFREQANGLIYTLFCLFNIWATDSFALFGGKLFGKRQLSPISPNKTIEGTVIGILFSLIISSLFCYYVQLPYNPFLLFALLISVLGQVGDLHESLAKRYFKIKDSSQLLPGHGGFYDRSDSSIFVFPILYILFIGLL